MVNFRLQGIARATTWKCFSGHVFDEEELIDEDGDLLCPICHTEYIDPVGEENLNEQIEHLIDVLKED